MSTIARENIVEFTVLSWSIAKSVLGKRVDIASDELAGNQAVDVLSAVSGRKMEYIDVLLDRSVRRTRALPGCSSGSTASGTALAPQLYAAARTFEVWAKAQSGNLLKPTAQ